MKIGCCAVPLDNWGDVADLGYDYIEGNFSTIAMATEEEFEKIRCAKEKCGLSVEACNGFFPAEFVLYSYDKETGKENEGFADVVKKVTEYVTLGFERVSSLGCEVVVIGSGAARRVPEGMDRSEAYRQFSRILKIVADIALNYGITVTVEPLNSNETDLINTLGESLDVIDKLDHPNLLAMNDFFHFNFEKEPFSTLDRAGNRLVHLHICRLDRYGCSVEDRETLTPFVSYVVEHLGYGKRISLESRHSPDFLTSVAKAYELLKEFR